MSTETKVQRLAALLNLGGTVRFAPYKGPGERTHKAGFRVALLGPHSADGQNDKGALVALGNVLAKAAAGEPARLMREASAANFSAERARLAERSAREDAERAETKAQQFRGMADRASAELAAIRAELRSES